jgi:hypothetical protein
MDFSSLFRKDSARRLKIKSGGGSSGKGTSSNVTENSTTDEGKYLLSNLHLKISLVSSGEEDASKLHFHWYVKNISDTEITIQFVFEDAVFISTNANNPDKLLIQFLPASLAIFKSKSSKLPIEKGLRTESQSINLT